MVEKRNILVVDNDPDWLDICSEALTRNKLFDVKCVDNRRDAIKFLKNGHFDLVFMNLLLREAFSGPWRVDCTYILDEISERRCNTILITGSHEQDLEAMKTLFELQRKYKVIVDVLEKGKITTYDIRDAAENATTHLKIDDEKLTTIEDKTRTVGIPDKNAWELEYKGIPYNIDEGIHYDILRGIETHIKKVKFDEQAKQKLWALLSKPQDDTAFSFAIDLWLYFWVEDVGLPPFHAIKLLATKEYKKELYKGYKDHVIHSILVYIFGLYVYYANRNVREAMAKVGTEENFLREWKIAALFHDIGYYLSVDDKEKTSAIQELLLSQLRQFIENPLKIYGDNFKRFKLLETDEREIRRISDRLPQWEIKTISDLRKPFAPAVGHILDELDDLLVDVNLSDHTKKRYCYRYDEYSLLVDRDTYERCDDHGMISAMILLGSYTYFQRYVETTCESKILAQMTSVSEDIISELSQLPSQVVKLSTNVRNAAAAIALHNIYVTGWSTHDPHWAIARKEPCFLTLDRYKISLSKNPLAWLLAVSDAWQCWDRPNRNQAPLALQDCSLKNQEVRISTTLDDKIKVFFINDDYRGSPDSRFKKITGEMKKYLDNIDIFVEGDKE